MKPQANINQIALFEIEPSIDLNSHIETKKPNGTFYCDYSIEFGKVYAIFETKDGRLHKKFVNNTTKTLADWKGFSIHETETSLFIKI